MALDREPARLQDRRDEILDLAATRHELASDQAEGYLAVIYRTAPDDRIVLFELVITNHDARQRRRMAYKGPHAMKEKEWRKIAERLTEMVDGWAEEMLIANRTSRETAAVIWDRLQQFELPVDRTVALALLLKHRVIPYAQLPADYLTVVPKDVSWAARDRVATKVALLSRLFASRLSPLQTASAIARVLETVTDRDETISCLEYVLTVMAAAAHAGLGGLPGLSIMGGLINPDQLRHLLGRNLPPHLREALGLQPEDPEDEEDGEDDR